MVAATVADTADVVDQLVDQPFLARFDDGRTQKRFSQPTRVAGRRASRYGIPFDTALYVFNPLDHFCVKFRRQLGCRQPIRRLIRIERKTRGGCARVHATPIGKVVGSEALSAFCSFSQRLIKIQRGLMLAAEINQLFLCLFWFSSASGLRGARVWSAATREQSRQEKR